jgi:hypothetical protein
MTPYTLVKTFCWLLSGYCLLCLLMDIRTWGITARLYGRAPWPQAAAMLKLIAQSRIHYYLWGPIVPLVTIIGFSANGVRLPFSLTFSLCLFWAHILFYQALPPSVLLLGTSRPETGIFRYQLERALHPYRVIVLLEPAAVTTRADSAFRRNLLEWDNLRTSEGGWHSAVFGLLETVPALVIDARVPSTGVVEEVRRVSTRGLLEKTLFVTADDGVAPAVGEARVQIPSGILVRDAEVATRLKAGRLRETASPDDHPLFRNLGD